MNIKECEAIRLHLPKFAKSGLSVEEYLRKNMYVGVRGRLQEGRVKVNSKVMESGPASVYKAESDKGRQVEYGYRQYIPSGAFGYYFKVKRGDTILKEYGNKRPITGRSVLNAAKDWDINLPAEHVDLILQQKPI